MLSFQEVAKNLSVKYGDGTGQTIKKMHPGCREQVAKNNNVSHFTVDGWVWDEIRNVYIENGYCNGKAARVTRVSGVSVVT